MGLIRACYVMCAFVKFQSCFMGNTASNPRAAGVLYYKNYLATCFISLYYFCPKDGCMHVFCMYILSKVQSGVKCEIKREHFNW